MKNLEDEMMDMVHSDPSKFIKYLEDNKINFKESAKRLDLGRKFVRERYSMSQQNIDAVEFVFWFAYFVEREARDLIVEPEIHAGGRKEAIEILVDKLHFGDKITIIEKLYTNAQDDFIKLMRKVQELRNAVAHGRFNDLMYKGRPLADASGQILITADLMNALLKKPKTDI